MAEATLLEATNATSTQVGSWISRPGSKQNVAISIITTGTTLLTVRHLNRPGVLAHVFHVLSDGGINVEEMENVIYEGAEAACAHIQLDAAPTGGQLDVIKKNENILSLGLAPLPEGPR